jgi:hypothetical protein
MGFVGSHLQLEHSFLPSFRRAMLKCSSFT